MKNAPCLAPEELGHLLAASPQDPRWEHVADCPRCRVLVAEYGAFLAGNPATAEAEADRVLASRVRSALEEETVSLTGGGRRGRSWRGPIIGASMALAAALGGVMILSDRGGPTGAVPIVVRGADSSTEGPLALEPVRILQDGRWELTWRKVEGALDYHVLIARADLTPLVRWDAGVDTMLAVVPPADADPGTPLFWRVEAVGADGVLVRSGLIPLPRP